MVVEFNGRESASIKSFAVKKRSSTKVTLRFMSGKSLMFAKLSLKSFIYDLVETMHFLNETVKRIYEKYEIERVEIFHVLADTDSKSLKFMLISDPNIDTPECKYCDIIF